MGIRFAFLVSTIVSFSFFAQAAEIPPICYSKAEKLISQYVESGYYDKDGLRAYECAWAKNGKAILCAVSASKGGGNATDSFRVVFNENCGKTYRMEMTGEE